MESFDREIARLNRINDAIDKQVKQIEQTEEKHKNDIDSLIAFWERIWEKGGPKARGVGWPFRLVELYLKAKRNDDAWSLLNDLVITRPEYIEKTRKWQIKILKKEKKDYSRFQQLLDSGQ